MANPYFDLNPAMSGVLAQPQTITNPVQNPLSPQDAATVAAMGDARAKNTALKQALLRAAVLRDQPLYAQGAGPLGARQGQGGAGWAVTLADVIAGAIAKKKHDTAGLDVSGALGAEGVANQEYIKNFINGAPGGMYGSGFGMSDAQRKRMGQDQLSYVSQGSPLSLGNQ